MKIKEIYTKENLKNMGIGACNIVGELEYEENKIIYIAQTPQNHDYNGYRRNTTRAYVCQSGMIFTLFSNLSNHRAKKAIKAYKKGDVGTVIMMNIWENYITNGYNTRRGLYTNYSENTKNRINKIAQSHADYIGNETWNSSIDHNNRVLTRR